MVSIIVGNKGSGKTKRWIDMVNHAADASRGNVICVEKGQKLTFDVAHRVRLVDTEAYGINGYDEYYGMLSGLCAGNYDLTDIFGDATLKIGGRDFEALAHFLDRISALAEESNTRFTFTISCDASELPAGIEHFAQVL